jgi:hypothetical protein
MLSMAMQIISLFPRPRHPGPDAQIQLELPRKFHVARWRKSFYAWIITAKEIPMKTDRYTKAVLTVIAAALAVLAVEQSSLPHAHAAPSGEGAKFADVTYDYGGNSITFFNKTTGDLWYYGAFGSEEKPQHAKLNQLGAPLEKDK